MTRTSATSIAGALLMFGCDTTRLDAGSNPDPGDDVEGHVWTGTPSNSYDIPCDAPAPDWLGGTWEGQFDAYALPSGSDAVSIEVRGLQAGGWVCGTIMLGTGDPLPLPTDPKAPPPGLSSAFESGTWTQIRLREGFPYELLSPDALHDWPPLVDQRLRFMINLAESYKAWCNMQPSYPWTDQAELDRRFPGEKAPVYTCLSPGKRISRDYTYCHGAYTAGRNSCAQSEFCSGPPKLCDCYGPGAPQGNPSSMWDGVSDGCTARDAAVPLDLTVTDGTMAGNVVFGDGIEGMHLTRTPSSPVPSLPTLTPNRPESSKPTTDRALTRTTGHGAGATLRRRSSLFVHHRTRAVGFESRPLR